MHSHPEAADTLIVGAQLYDGTGAPPVTRDVAIRNGVIAAIGNLSNWLAETVVDANGRALAPDFVDVHTHDDTHVIRAPEMLPKISQGVTTVIVGNCGISASPVTLAGDPPDPMNLLGDRDAFRYPTFAAYVAAVNDARPAVNVAALVGHTALRNNQMDRLDRAATDGEIAGMRAQLEEALKVYRAAGIKSANIAGHSPWMIPWLLRLPDFLFAGIAPRMVSLDPRARTSMLEDLEHGRKTEIDYLHGEIAALGRRHGVPTPAIDEMIRLVKAAEAAGKGSPRLKPSDIAI